MKKIISMVLMIAMLVSFSALAETAGNFDLNVFYNQKRQDDALTNQYSISLDDMEARGFISINRSITPSNYDYTVDRFGYGSYLYVCYPDIYLAKYGTSGFYPLPRIWFNYYGKDMLTYETVIFKIGDNTFTFYESGVASSLDLSNWSREVDWQSKTVCLCDSTYIDFMDAWIANGTAPIKVRLKCNKDSVDFILEEGSQADTLLMFQNFKDAGGYTLLPTN
ncbi:MAG: hypothetical protein IJA26_00610 [Clostridia bacterium]|nr:hypothetical protein [Clostridia bacterium]